MRASLPLPLQDLVVACLLRQCVGQPYGEVPAVVDPVKLVAAEQHRPVQPVLVPDPTRAFGALGRNGSTAHDTQKNVLDIYYKTHYTPDAGAVGNRSAISRVERSSVNHLTMSDTLTQ